MKIALAIVSLISAVVGYYYMMALWWSGFALTAAGAAMSGHIISPWIVVGLFTPIVRIVSNATTDRSKKQSDASILISHALDPWLSLLVLVILRWAAS